MEIDHVALLARVELSDDEKKLFSGQVGRIIDYIDKLNNLQPIKFSYCLVQKEL